MWLHDNGGSEMAGLLWFAVLVRSTYSIETLATNLAKTRPGIEAAIAHESIENVLQ